MLLAPLRALSIALVLAGVMSWCPHTLEAQDRFDVEAFDPATDQEGSVLSVYGARTLTRGEYGVSLLASYGRHPLSLEDEDGNDLGDLVGSVGTLSFMGTVGLTDWLDVGLAIPLRRMTAGSEYAIAPPLSVQAATLQDAKVALGDIRLVPRASLMKHDGESGVDLSLLVPLYLPTGNDDAYAGEPFRVEPRVAVDYRHPRVLVAFNVGYLVRNQARLLDARVDDMLRVGLGTDVRLAAGLSLLAEIDMQLNLLSDSFDRTDAPSEGLLGLRFRHSGFMAQAGAGPGFVRGVTAPSFRVFAGVGYARSTPPERDQDGDGVLDGRDRCASEPEDRDGFQDDDGCPDPDNDGDGVPDAQDGCRDVAEDKDGVEDEDGCVDGDDDRDGIADAQDRCPREPEDKDGFDDEDGCPDRDNDGDGVPDAADRCPNEKGTAEAMGCASVEPPKAPEPEAPVVVKDDRIELKEAVFFALNSAVIEERSSALLDAIAKVLTEHPEIEHVVVEGHTDDTGKPFHNRTLSKARAKAVGLALVARGVAASRLSSEGFGPDRPMVPNDSDENRAKNRRVELRITRRAGEAAAPAPALPGPGPSSAPAPARP